MIPILISDNYCVRDRKVVLATYTNEGRLLAVLNIVNMRADRD